MVISGIGLHGAKHVSVDVVAEAGPIRFERDGVVRALDAFRVSNTTFSTSIACDAFELHTVEHLFAALAGLGVRDGLRFVVSGGAELPLLDGAAAQWVTCIAAFEIPSRSPTLRIAREERIEVDGSIYELTPGPSTRIAAEADLPSSCARFTFWDADDTEGFSYFANARTFALESDVVELTQRGLARHVDPQSVLVVGETEIHGVGHIAMDEPVRHKLLDLIGDAFFHGGPPRGTLRVTRPGHTRNHAAFLRAIETHVLVRDPP